MKKALYLLLVLLPALGRSETAQFQDLQAEFKKEFNTAGSYKLNSRQDYARARAQIKQYGPERFFAELVKFGVFGQDGQVLPTLQPFNVFARMITGDLEVPYGDILGADPELVQYSQLFMLAKNLPANDLAWDNVEKASQGQASMGLRHRFLIPRDRHWANFNVLTIGLSEDGPHGLKNSIEYLETMKKAALAYVQRDSSNGWSKNTGLYFHCFPFNSIQYLHLHIVDLDFTGPAFGHYFHKNLSIDDVIDQLKDELQSNSQINGF